MKVQLSDHQMISTRKMPDPMVFKRLNKHYLLDFLWLISSVPTKDEKRVLLLLNVLLMKVRDFEPESLNRKIFVDSFTRIVRLMYPLLLILNFQTLQKPVSLNTLGVPNYIKD